MSVRRVKQLALNDTAAVAPLYAIAIVTLVAIAGVGFDYTRMMGLHSELQNAADQAALAGASQLDGEDATASLPGACARATNAVRNFVTNNSRFAEDGSAAQITFQNETTCDATGSIRFWQDRDGTNPATDDANAHFIEVVVDPRATRFALTPLVDAFGSGPMRAAAMAGVGSAICKQPPIMICHPDPGDEDSPNPFNADARKGQGVLATGHTTGKPSNSGGDAGGGSTPATHWSPGNFGFLEIPDDPTNAALLKAMAYINPPISCTNVDDNEVSTGSPQGLYDAINTRFGIYDFNYTGNANGNNVLADCQGNANTPGKCPPANNVRMDLQTTISNGNGNAGQHDCKLGKSNATNGNSGKGYMLPPAGSEFRPMNLSGAAYSPTALYHSNTNPIARMGMPRDLCHYNTYPDPATSTGLCNSATSAGTGRIGDGNWAREDYWQKNHAGHTKPANYSTITRYDLYKWENSQGYNVASPAKCGNPKGDETRRVMTIAVVRNCKALRGGSVKVDIDEFVDVFLVEPSIDDNLRHNAFKDSIYFEIIGKSQIAGNGVFGSQEVRRDVPYLVR